MRCNGWSDEEACPHLVRGLRNGPGRFAVESWKEAYGGEGSFEQLVRCASYLAGSIGDPMATFLARTQKPNETH